MKKMIQEALKKSREDKAAKQKAAKDKGPEWLVMRFLERKTMAGQLWSRVMLTLVILNVLAVILETVQEVYVAIGPRVWRTFEVVSVFAFTGMYLAQIYAAPVNSKFNGNKWGNRWAFVKSFWGIVDLVTVAPWWMQQALAVFGFAPAWMTHAFIFRVVRVLRILQLEDFVHSFTLLTDAWYTCRDSMVACGFLALMVWVCGSVLFYNFEKDNPRMEGAFDSLPGMYYSLIFLGGEWGLVDFTPCGQVVCIFYCVIGIGLYGIPVGAVFEAFSDVLAAQEAKEQREEAARQKEREADAAKGLEVTPRV